MAETHINAYFADVDEKQRDFELAGAELQASRDRLETKKREIGYVDPEVSKDENPDVRPTASNVFKRK